ncbi:MAG: T9SS type A sorting domain-containing protein [Bacteroidota bacterium]
MRILTSVIFLVLTLVTSLHAEIVPLSLEERVANSPTIALVKVGTSHSYWNEAHTNIHTLYRLEVLAYLKGHSPATEVGLVASGGVVGNKAEVVFPAVKLQEGQELVVFLENSRLEVIDPQLAIAEPGLLQAQAYGCTQGTILRQFNEYKDILTLDPMSEASLLGMIANLTGEAVLTPLGEEFRPRSHRPLRQTASRMITGISTTSGNYGAGTIEADRVLTITGTGFGTPAVGDATPANTNVFFPNGDNGGANLVTVPNESDYISWTNTQIQVQIPREGGTGTLEIIDQTGGTNTSLGTANITIPWSVLNVYSNFSMQPAVIRQQVELANVNTTGGLTFQYNSTEAGPNGGAAMDTDAAAQANFVDALNEWRCNTFVNYTISSTSTTGRVADDGISSVLWNAGLPAGVLGRANSFYSGSAVGGCTVWYVNSADISFRPVPNTGFTWNHSGAPTVLEYDFESVAVHELGHAHGFGHKISSGEVMHYVLFNGQFVRTLSATDITGGTYKMGHSTSPYCLISSSFSPMTALTSSNCTFPVEWSSFEGSHISGTGNLLEWVTASESQNDFFAIEHRMEAESFAEVGTMPGSGTTLEPTSYSFTHETMLPGTHYYRLRQVDLNGEFSYSAVIEVRVEPSTGMIIFPNPANDKLYLSLPDAQNQSFEVIFVSVDGKMVKHIPFAKGEIQHEIELEDWARGLYVYQVLLPNGARYQGKLFLK